MDLRLRLLAAIDGGASCRVAAERFGVAPSTAIRWQAQRRETGDFAPKPQGGDMRSRRVEALTVISQKLAIENYRHPSIDHRISLRERGEVPLKGTSFHSLTLHQTNMVFDGSEVQDTFHNLGARAHVNLLHQELVGVFLQ